MPVIQRTEEQLRVVAMTQAEVDALPEEGRREIALAWAAAAAVLMAQGPEPRGPVQ